MHSPESFKSYENLIQKETLKSIETSQQRKERLVIFWLKQKASYPVLKNLLKEIISIKKEIEEQNNAPEDLKDLYEENKLDLLNKLEQKKQELEKIAFVVKVEEPELINICDKYYDSPKTISQILLNHLWYKPTYPIGISLPLPHSYLFKNLIKKKTENNLSPKSPDNLQISEQKELKISKEEVKELAEKTEKLESGFENKLNIFSIWIKLIARYLVKRLQTFSYPDFLEPQLKKKIEDYSENLTSTVDKLNEKYKKLKDWKFVFSQKDFEQYKQSIENLNKDLFKVVNSIHNIYKEWSYKMFWKKYKIKAPRILVYDFKNALENILQQENPSIKGLILSFRKLDSKLPWGRLELSGEIKDLTIQYLLNYDKEFQSIPEIKILSNPINFKENLEKLPSKLQEEINELIKKYKQQAFKDSKTTIPFNEYEIYLNPNFQNEVKNIVVKYLVDNNKLNNIENQDLLKILKDFYWQGAFDLADSTINSAHNVKDFIVDQIPLLLPSLKFTKLVFPKILNILEKSKNEKIIKIVNFLKRTPNWFKERLWQSFVKWNLETIPFVASYESLSSIMDQKNEFTLENIWKDWELIVLLHLLDGIKIWVTDKLWNTKYSNLLDYIKKQQKLVKYILNTGVDVAMLAQAEKIVKLTFTGKYELTDEELATIISMVIIVNKLIKADEVRIVKENDKFYGIIEKENKIVKIPIEIKKEGTKKGNKKDEVNIFKAKWWESTVWDKTARLNLERVIKKEELQEKSKEIKKNLESEIREEFRNLLNNLKSIKWTKELDLKIEESISSVLKKYKETWAISDTQYKIYKKSLTKQFKEALYLKIKWKEIPERLDWEKIGNKEFINKFFDRLRLEIDKYPSLKKDILHDYNLLPEQNLLDNIINWINQFKNFINLKTYNKTKNDWN